MEFVYSLGGGEDDVKEIMRHEFFEGLNWRDMYDKKVGQFFNFCSVNKTKFHIFTKLFKFEKDVFSIKFVEL